MKKRLFSWLLVLAMVLSMMPTVAFAEEVKPNQLLQKEELFTVDAATTYDPTAEGAILVPADDTSWTSGGVSGSVPGAWADIHASDYLRVFMYTATDADLETVSAKLKTSFTLSGSYTFYFEIQPRTNDVEVALPGVKVGGKTLKLKFEPNGIAKLYNAAYSKDLEIGGAGTSWTYVTITVDADAPSVTVKVIRTNTVEETITASDELTLTTANAPATFELVQAAAGTSQVRLDKIRYWCDHAAKSKTAIGEAVEATCTTAGQTAGVKCADCESVWEAVETITATGHS